MRMFNQMFVIFLTLSQYSVAQNRSFADPDIFQKSESNEQKIDTLPLYLHSKIYLLEEFIGLFDISERQDVLSAIDSFDVWNFEFFDIECISELDQYKHLFIQITPNYELNRILDSGVNHFNCKYFIAFKIYNGRIISSFRLQGFSVSDANLYFDSIFDSVKSELNHSSKKKFVKNILKNSDYVEMDGLHISCLMNKWARNKIDFHDCYQRCNSSNYP